MPGRNSVTVCASGTGITSTFTYPGSTAAAWC